MPFSSRGRPKTDLQIAIFVGPVWSQVSQSAFTGEYSYFVSTNYCSLSPLWGTGRAGPWPAVRAGPLPLEARAGPGRSKLLELRAGPVRAVALGNSGRSGPKPGHGPWVGWGTGLNFEVVHTLPYTHHPRGTSGGGGGAARPFRSNYDFRSGADYRALLGAACSL